MNPQTPTRPVMDVAAPPRIPRPHPDMQPTPTAPAPAQAENLPVRLAPEEIAAQAETQNAPQSTAPAPPAQNPDKIPQPAAKQERAKPVPAAPGTPVGLISVTILCMLVLSAAVTIIYFTTKS